jgi:hypothetical protein
VITTATMTKRAGLLWLAIGLFAGLALAATFGGGAASADGHVTGLEEVRTNGVEQNFTTGTSREKTEVWIYGSGFTPGTEVFTLISDSNGVWTDITIPAGKRKDGGGTVYPLVANDDGAWATEWRIGRFSRRGVGGEGMLSLRVMDTGFNTLATTPLSLCNNVDRPASVKGVAAVAEIPAAIGVPAIPAVAEVVEVAGIVPSHCEN